MVYCSREGGGEREEGKERETIIMAGKAWKWHDTDLGDRWPYRKGGQELELS